MPSLLWEYFRGQANRVESVTREIERYSPAGASDDDRETIATAINMLQRRGLYTQALRERIARHPQRMDILSIFNLIDANEDVFGLSLSTDLDLFLRTRHVNPLFNACLLLNQTQSNTPVNQQKLITLLEGHVNFRLVIYLFVDAEEHAHLFTDETLSLIYDKKDEWIFHDVLAVLAGVLDGFPQITQAQVTRILNLETREAIVNFMANELQGASAPDETRNYIRQHLTSIDQLPARRSEIRPQTCFKPSLSRGF